MYAKHELENLLNATANDVCKTNIITVKTLSNLSLQIDANVFSEISHSLFSFIQTRGNVVWNLDRFL